MKKNSGSTTVPKKNGLSLFFIMMSVTTSAYLSTGTPILYAGEIPEKVGVAQPGEPCRVAPHPSWTKQESWIWKQVCKGKKADFNMAKGYGGKLDPSNPKGWPKGRRVRPSFLETILLREPFRSALPHQGVQIGGAWFTEPVDLSGATIEYDLGLYNTRFDKDVDLSRLRSKSLLLLDGSTFYGTLNMDSLQVGSHLFMRNGATFNKDVILRNARIGGQAAMDGSTFGGTLNMDSLQVGKNLFMRNNATFNKDVILRTARIGGQIDMHGSTFYGTLNMDSLQVGSHLFMRNRATFNKDVFLLNARIGGQVEMDGSTFDGTLNMGSLQVEESLLMRTNPDDVEHNRTRFKKVILLNAKIGKYLEMDGSTFDGTVDMDSLQVGKNLFMRNNATFNKDVILLSARIDGQVAMDGSTFDGTLNMDSLQVGSHLFMRNRATFNKDVILRNARIGGQIDMDGSTFDGTVDMDSLQVGKNLFIRNALIQNSNPIDLVYATVEGNLDISGSKLSTTDLTGATVKKEFRLNATTDWKKASSLKLRNASVGALQDHTQGWPDKLEIDGFVYQRLGGLTNGNSDSMSDRDENQLKAWLKKQVHYSPQPYTQLATILKRSGHPDMAKEILYESYDRERMESANGSHWLWLWIKKVLIGYGYKIWYSLFWILLFVVAGSFIFKSGKEAKENNMPYGIAYSLDMLLPIIKLREQHYKIDLSGWRRYYFYFHMIMGYVLASFLIAGLSGMTS